jgi:hypothetical protein
MNDVCKQIKMITVYNEIIDILGQAQGKLNPAGFCGELEIRNQLEDIKNEAIRHMRQHIKNVDNF